VVKEDQVCVAMVVVVECGYCVVQLVGFEFGVVGVDRW